MDKSLCENGVELVERQNAGTRKPPINQDFLRRCKNI